MSNDLVTKQSQALVQQALAVAEASAKAPKLRVGARVKLRGVAPCDDYPEGLPEERGVLRELEPEFDMAIVDVDPQYRGEDDDGMREVPMDMIELDSAPAAKRPLRRR